MKRLALAAFAVLLLLSGCGSARRGVPITGPHTLEDPLLVAGKRAFDAYCHQCHPGGTAGLGFALNDKPLPGFLIRFQVRNGLGAMPSFPPEVVSDEELDAIVAYMKWLRQLKPVPASLPPRPGG